MEWFNEKVENIIDDKFLYKVICFFLGGPKHRMSYKEIYLLLYGLNRRKLGEKTAKKKAMERIIEIYKTHHDNNPPTQL
jgi:hypothetical protein